MLLDIEINIKITNDGKKNLISISVNGDKKIRDVITGIELGRMSMEELLENHIKKIAPITEDEFKKIYRTLTMNKIENKINNK